jgi:hypothetical protein
MTPAGFPHSEIPGSKPVCGSPRLIAAYRVLHRLSAPRHPPCTLSSLTKLELSFSGESYRFSPDSVVKETRSFKIRACLRASPRGNRASERLTQSPGLATGLSTTKELCGAFPTVDPDELVELIGFEPTTSALQGRRSPS